MVVHRYAAVTYAAMIYSRRPHYFASHALFAGDLILVWLLLWYGIHSVVAHLVTETPLADALFVLAAWLG
jgi:hypothetical protein